MRAELAMQAWRAVTQFQHIAEHSDAPPCGQRGQRPQRSVRRRRRSIVGVVKQQAAVGTGKRHQTPGLALDQPQAFDRLLNVQSAA